MATTSLGLLDRLRGHDGPAWQRLVDVYGPLLRLWLGGRGLQPADLDDLAQEVLAVVARRLGEFRHNRRPGAFRAWLRNIAANKLRDHLRGRARKGGRHEPDGERLLAELADPDSGLSRWWEAEHDRHVARRLAESLRGEFRESTWEAFRLVVLEDRPAADVADSLGLTVNAVLIARSRVLARLRREAGGLLP